MSDFRFTIAWAQSRFGGILIDTFIFISGRITFPAFEQSGNPLEPVIDNWDLQVLWI